MAVRDVLAALLVALVLGLAFVAIKVGLEVLPPLLLTALRFLFAALPGVFLVRPPRTPARLVVAFGLFHGVALFGLMFLAIAWGMPAGLSSLVAQVQVFFTIGLAFLIFRERPSGLQVFGGCVAACGIAVIAAWQAQSAAILPLLLVLAAALSWAAANLVAKAAGPTDTLAFMVWVSLVATPPLLVLSLVFEGPAAIARGLAGADWRTVAAVLFIAYPTTILAFTLWNGLLARYPAATVTPFALLVPVVGIVGTNRLLGEPFESAEAVGAALIFAGIALNVLAARRKRAAAPVPAAPAPRGP